MAASSPTLSPSGATPATPSSRPSSGAGGGARSRGRTAALAGTALVVAVLATFVWLRAELARDLDRLADLHRVALTPELLGPPLDPVTRSVELHRVAEGFAAAPAVARVAISKVVEVPRLDGARREWLLVPADDGRRPLDEATRGAVRYAIELGDDPAEPDAFLYLWPDATRLRVLTAWIVALGGMLAAAGLVAVARARRREEELEAATIELASRRAELRRAERLAFVGQLAAGLLHDLKKPVNTIRALAGEQLSGVTLDSPGAGIDDESLNHHLGMWREVAEQTDLFQGLLRATRIERYAQAGAPDAEWCDLHDLISRAVDLVQCERGDCEVVRRDDADVPLVRANPYELMQVLSNLVLNAYQAMHATGGRVEIATRRVAAGERLGEGGGIATRDLLVVTIDDTGPGIGGDFLPRLFEPFATTRLDAGGSGLGTYIAREIVMSLGGTLRAEAHGPLHGARFTITLPASDEEEALRTSRRSAGEGSGAGAGAETAPPAVAHATATEDEPAHATNGHHRAPHPDAAGLAARRMPATRQDGDPAPDAP